MKGFIAWIKDFAVEYGGPGLLLIGFLDSSFLSLPEINDLLIVFMVTRQKHLVLYYALMATIGSLMGCLALYYVARRGGEAFLRKRFKASHVERGLNLYRKYGLLVVIVPALLPPPAPFKIFVLLAGVSRVPVWQFVAAVFTARFIRYFGEGMLAVYYGDQASAFIQAYAKEVGLGLAVLILAGGVAWILWKRRKARLDGEKGETAV
jgi:membrane protein YqaA with SNARE-associated domain